MNILKRVLPLLFVFTIFLLPHKVEAAQFFFKEQTVAQETTIEEDVYLIGSNSSVYGVIDGDLFILSDKVIMEGTVTGDMYVIGSEVTIDGNIYGNLVVIANESNISGVLSNNACVLSTFLTYDGQAGKDLLTVSMESDMKGTIGDDLRAFGYINSIESVVKGDALVIAGQYSVLKENVTGNIYNTNTLKDIAKEQGVDLDAEKEERMEITRVSDYSLKILNAFLTFVGFSIAGYVLIYLSPVKTGQIVNKVSKSPVEFLKSLAVGIGVLFLVPLPLFLLSLTLVGIPLALFILGTLIFLTTFGKIYVESALGKEILELFGTKEYRPYKGLLVGRVLSTLMSLVPIFGVFYSLTISATAVGAVVRMKKDSFANAKKVNKKKKK